MFDIRQWFSKNSLQNLYFMFLLVMLSQLDNSATVKKHLKLKSKLQFNDSSNEKRVVLSQLHIKSTLAQNLKRVVLSQL